jgi:hypothetical protein
MAAKEQPVTSVDSGYDADFYQWTQSTAELIRQGRMGDVDWEHVAEEIQDMGKRDHREVRSRLIVLIEHLLKWHFQPERRTASWRATISDQRRELTLVIGDSPSLKRIPRETLPALYRSALKDAAEETGMDVDRFPKTCPYSTDQLLDRAFLPD